MDMNRKNLLLLPLFALSLASCVDSDELYPGYMYSGPDFIANRYNHYDEGLKEAEVTQTIELNNDKNASGRFFCGSGKFDSLSGLDGHGQLKEWHEEAVGNLSWENDITRDTRMGVWTDQTPMVGVSYGATNKMTLINERFAKGYLSKLYNGQVLCHGWSSYAWVVLDQSGFGTRFPGEIKNAKYFAVALRGGSDFNPERLSSFDISVTFYKENGNKSLNATRITMKDAKLKTNYSTYDVSLVGFYFNELGVTFDPNGIVAMSMDYKLNGEDYSLSSQGMAGMSQAEASAVHASTDFDDDEEYHVGLFATEIFMPGSEWY